jgi:hypothetical protein
MVKVETAENLSSGAKAQRFLSAFYGTAEAVPFQNPTCATNCQRRQGYGRLRFLSYSFPAHAPEKRRKNGARGLAAARKSFAPDLCA